MAWVFNKTLWVPSQAPYINAAQLNRIEDGIDKANPQLVSALPGAPFDGQEIHYQTVAMAALGIRWRFVYNAGSASAYKWEFIGGSTWATFITATVTTVSVYPALVDLGGPSIAVPLAGDFIVEAIVNAYRVDTGSIFMAVNDGAANQLGGDSGPSSGYGTQLVLSAQLTRAAAATWKMLYASSSATGAWFRNRTLKITPVRVG